MVERNVQIELTGNAQGGQNVVRAVRVGLERNLLANDGQQSLQLHIKRAGLGGVFFRRIDFSSIALRLEELFAQERRDRHAGDGFLMAVLTIAALGVLAESNLHGDGILDNHIVDAVAIEFEGNERAAEDIRRAGAGGRGGHHRLQGRGGTLRRGD